MNWFSPANKKGLGTRNAIFTTLGIIISLIFILTAFELFLRIDGRYRLYHEKNNQPYASQYTGRTSPEHLFRYLGHDTVSTIKKEFTEVRVINNLGYTDTRDINEIDSSSKTIRILALGDSFTEGMGALYQESWPQVLERLLNKSVNEQKFVVYNAGVSGCDPFFSYQNMKFLASKIHPQIIILLINTTDYTDVYFRGGWERFKDGNKVIYTRQAPWWEPLYAKIHFIRALVDFLGYNIFLTNDPYEQAIMSSFPLIQESLDSFRIYSEVNHQIFVPVFNPIPTYHSEEQYAQDNIFVHQFVAPGNPFFLDLTHAVRSHRTKEYFWENDNHCTPKGYQLFAEEILNHLKKTQQGFFATQN